VEACPASCDCKANVNRRDFLKLGATLAGAIAGSAAGQAQAAPEGFIPPEAHVPPSREWFESLHKSGEPIVYRGAHLREIIFPLGGIGTGTVWLNGAGRLVNWQIFNNIQKDTYVDDTFFAVRIEQAGKPPVVRVLQASAMGPAKGFEDISLLGRYPVATFTFKDDSLPVELELEAFNPLVPLDEKSSGLPCAIFTLRARNRTREPVKISFLGTLQNAVGHAGSGSASGVRHIGYGGNINERIADGLFTAVAMRAQPGTPARIDPAVEIMTDHANLPIMDDAPVEGLSIASLVGAKKSASPKPIYWLAEGNLKLLGGSILGRVAADVRERGGFLLLSGAANPLMDGVTTTAPAGEERRETVFASFDGKDYGDWTVEGNAFGTGPATGTQLNQNPVSGFTGAGLVNTYQGTDLPQGRLSSPPFTVEQRYISFLIGGGQYPGQCCLNLLVDGKVVRSETGQNTEQLRRVEWDVRELAGKQARIEIVDRRSDGWGHVLADDIRFSNLPIDAITAADAEQWNEMIRLAAAAEPMTAVAFGTGRVMRVPVELGTLRPGVDPIRQRDNVLELIARLADLQYRPARGQPDTAPSFGTMCLATVDTGAAARASWTDRDELFAQFAETGTAKDADAAAAPSPAGRTVNAAIAHTRTIAPEQSGEGRFIIAWHFPNQYYPQQNYRHGNNKATLVGNMYDNWFRDAEAVARHVATELPRLRSATCAYRDAMFDTSLPQYFIDAVAANVSILRSPTCFRIKDGTFYGFEGCNPQGGGCCPMNCNHVWNYEQTLAKLWPALERDMRVTELQYQQREDGGTHHRVSVPRTVPSGQIAVADGQCGAVLKAYREHLQSADNAFLDAFWPRIRKAMDYAIEAWDKDADGIMDQPQFNTYDRVIFGKNTFVSSLYLAALRAAEEMARLKNDDAAADRYRGLYEKGRAYAAEKLFDGEYYIQIEENLTGGYGKGCLADQVVGQWWACVLGLGDILPAEQVRSALTAIFKHNWLWTQKGFVGTQRFLQFADGDDKGLLICSWPKGGRPADPILYRDEVWTGVEYQVAAHKIYVGQIEEGLAIVRGVRERYDGRKKSPWNEIECGDYYARALSSWSLLLAAQGYTYNGPARSLGFDPRLSPDNHRSFFTTAEGWGTFSQERRGGGQHNTLAVAGGRCELAELRLGLPAETKRVTGRFTISERETAAQLTVAGGHALIRFDEPAVVTAGEKLDVRLELRA